MKKRGIIIAVIVLLSIWAVLATIVGAIQSKTKSELVRENSQLESGLEKQEEVYEKLNEEFSELEIEYENLENERRDLNAKYTLHLAYEWMFDILANSEVEGYSADASLDKICEREGFVMFEKSFIAEKAQQILSEYGIEIQ